MLDVTAECYIVKEMGRSVATVPGPRSMCQGQYILPILDCQSSDVSLTATVRINLFTRRGNFARKGFPTRQMLGVGYERNQTTPYGNYERSLPLEKVSPGRSYGSAITKTVWLYGALNTLPLDRVGYCRGIAESGILFKQLGEQQ
ncbi:MAG: hypothetical protein EOM21_18580 [Gammaproteobacteria bacterium]|nr:hypothetical protein [Gammaproteobacteria bacterium]